MAASSRTSQVQHAQVSAVRGKTVFRGGLQAEFEDAHIEEHL
jgi:hypothetical protein